MLLLSLIHLIELREEHLLLFGKVAVELRKRLGDGGPHLMQLGMSATMGSLHLLHQLHQCLVMEVEVAMMLLQHVVKKQVQWPCREIERAGRGLRIAIQRPAHPPA